MWNLIRFLPQMATGRLPKSHPILDLGQAARVEVHSEAPLCVHAEGEFICTPQDAVQEVVVEMLPGRLRVEVYPTGLYGAWAR